MNQDSETKRLWDVLESHLLVAKRAATQEIRNYPQPIAGCDAQISALWERRDGAVKELERLASLRTTGNIDALDAFLTHCAVLDKDTVKAIRETARTSLAKTSLSMSAE